MMPILCVLCFAVEAWACPVCNTETGAQVRQKLLADDLLRNAAYVVAPIPVLLGIVAAIYFGVPRWLRGDQERGGGYHERET